MKHRIAAWIFERLGLDMALAGDLLEERARGRSEIWYWRQALLAIWAGIWRAIFDHKLLALTAVATGCAVNSVWLFLWTKFLHFGLPLTPMISIESIASLSYILLTQAATGWIVARTHRAHAIPMVIVFAMWLTGWYFVNAFTEVHGVVDQPRFRPFLAWHLVPIAAVVAGLLLGGIVGARRKKESRDPEMV